MISKRSGSVAQKSNKSGKSSKSGKSRSSRSKSGKSDKDQSLIDSRGEGESDDDTVRQNFVHNKTMICKLILFLPTIRRICLKN